MDEFITESTQSGRIYQQVHQMNKLITKSTKWTNLSLRSTKWMSLLPNPQNRQVQKVDESKKQASHPQSG